MEGVKAELARVVAPLRTPEAQKRQFIQDFLRQLPPTFYAASLDDITTAFTDYLARWRQQYAPMGLGSLS